MRSEISLHELLTVEVLLRPPLRWWMNAEIAKAIKPHEMLPGGVAVRTIRAHVTRLAANGILDVADVFPGHRYRWSAHAGVAHYDYCRRLWVASGILGVTIEAFGEANANAVPAFVELSDGKFIANPIARPPTKD